MSRMIYGNKEIVRTFTRNNSPAGYVGGSVDYRVPPNVYLAIRRRRLTVRLRMILKPTVRTTPTHMPT